ncbi:MAG: PadR family transcriptional regulator [Planctomycetota bacterium]|jgi:DNA-binding PadR family transcriptional regulator
MEPKILSEKEYQLLLLCVSERSGREVAKRYETEAGRSISYGTLYTTFRRLHRAGLVHVRDDSDSDGRVRYFRCTGAGHRSIRATIEHHCDLLRWASRVGGVPSRLGKVRP